MFSVYALSQLKSSLLNIGLSSLLGFAQNRQILLKSCVFIDLDCFILQRFKLFYVVVLIFAEG